MPPITSSSPLHPSIEESPSVLANDIDNNESETSPETAAVARGAVASARHSAKATASTAATSVTKVSVGRLPVTASNASRLPSASTSIAKPPLAKSFPRGRGSVRPTTPVRAGKATRVAVNRPSHANETIAKATDRVSTGLDVWNAAKEGGEAEGDIRDKRRKLSKWNSLLPSFGQVTAFARSFVTNTVLGMAVFATYEGVIDYLVISERRGEIFGSQISKNAELKNNEQPNKLTTSQFNDNDATINTADSIERNPAMEAINDTTTQITTLTDNPHNISTKEVEYPGQVSIPMHFFAGGLGGASHASLSLVLETKLITANQSENLTTNALHDRTRSTLISMPKPLSSMFRCRRSPVLSISSSPSNKMTSTSFLSLQYPAMNYSIATLAHHLLAHAVLFGSYQWMKRSLSECVTFYSCPIADSEEAAVTSQEKHIGFVRPYFGNNKDFFAHAAVITFAGGVAGQAQHLTSHLTEQWFGLTTTLTTKQKSLPEESVQLRKRILLSPWPSWRSTVLAFPPSAIGFLAFEYGKLMV
ncbi:hypothetical protein ACHAWX_007326 [Stephanocyclus meneghinianus]